MSSSQKNGGIFLISPRPEYVQSLCMAQGFSVFVHTPETKWETWLKEITEASVLVLDLHKKDMLEGFMLGYAFGTYATVIVVSHHGAEPPSICQRAAYLTDSYPGLTETLETLKTVS